jgi:hypothetical protein
MRQRLEERRQQMEEMREGPYDRYNLKVNSLAKVLEMSDAQKQAYFELTQQYTEKFRQAREKMQAEREAQRAQAEAAGETQPQEGERGRGGRGGDFREQFQQLMEPLQTEYVTATQSILEPYQIDVYNELSDSSKSFLNLGMVSAPGEEDTGMFGRMMGNFGGTGGFQGRGGGRTAGGRGGR